VNAALALFKEYMADGLSFPAACQRAADKHGMSYNELIHAMDCAPSPPITAADARARIDAARDTLYACGWTPREFAAAIDGLYREDAVEQAEHHARAALAKVSA
jgi:hypothetical protein